MNIKSPSGNRFYTDTGTNITILAGIIVYIIATSLTYQYYSLSYLFIKIGTIIFYFIKSILKLLRLITGSCGPSESIPSSNPGYRYYIIYTLIPISIETLLLLASLLNRYIRSRVYTL